MLKINKVTLNNYWSYENETIEYNYIGPVLVIGEKNEPGFSSNGAGKSSLFEAAMWCLFSKTTKGLLANTVVNYKAGKDCFVSVEGEINNVPFIVTRYRQHTTHKNDVHFTYNGIDSRGGTNQETNIKIEKTLNLDLEFFKQTCFFNPRTVQGFCSLSDSNKKTILEYILNLSKWEDYYNNASQDLNQEVAEKNSLEIKLKEYIANKNRFIENVYKPFLHSGKDNQNLEKKLKSIEEEIKAIDATYQQKPRESIDILAMQAKTIKEKINNNKCNACGQDVYIDKDKLKNQLKSILETINNTRKQKILYDKYIENINKIEKLKIEKTSIEKEIELSNQRKNSIKKLRLQIIDYDAYIKLSKEVINKVNKNISELSIIKKAFSPKGIKSYIIKDILPYLNDRLEYYAGELTNNTIKVRITFDYDTNRLVSSINKDVPYDYANLSSGEAKRVDLCMLFSLLDLMSTLKNRPNFIVLDEIFDSLDQVGLDKVTNLLYNIKYENIFVITHNNELKEFFTNKLLIKNEKGISRIVNGNEGQPINPGT